MLVSLNFYRIQLAIILQRNFSGFRDGIVRLLGPWPMSFGVYQLLHWHYGFQFTLSLLASQVLCSLQSSGCCHGQELIKPTPTLWGRCCLRLLKFRGQQESLPGWFWKYHAQLASYDVTLPRWVMLPLGKSEIWGVRRLHYGSAQGWTCCVMSGDSWISLGFNILIYKVSSWDRNDL